MPFNIIDRNTFGCDYLSLDVICTSVFMGKLHLEPLIFFSFFFSPLKKRMGILKFLIGFSERLKLKKKN
jgi:hypothetical protein